MSANHFDELQLLIGTMQRNRSYSDIIVYDLGLSTRQAKLVNRWCKCSAATFQFHRMAQSCCKFCASLSVFEISVTMYLAVNQVSDVANKLAS